MHSHFLVLGVCQLLLVSNTASAQRDSVSQPPRERGGHSRSLDHLSRSVNPLGTARVLVPGIALTYVSARLIHNESLSDGTLNTAAAYVAVDLIESVLKPVIGRERPHVEGNSRRFHPFTATGDWHSLPSAHVAHIASIAEAIAVQADSRPLSLISGALVAAVSWDRLYEDQHWASDVAVTIALSTAVSSATVRWLESHRR